MRIPCCLISFKYITLKNPKVEPPFTAPYLMTDWAAKSSALSILTSICSLVRKAAKLAVYEEVTISAKNHQKPTTNRVDTALMKTFEIFKYISFKSFKIQVLYLGSRSQPCCIIEPAVNHTQLCIFQMLSNSSGSLLHGCGFSQSSAANL